MDAGRLVTTGQATKGTMLQHLRLRKLSSMGRIPNGKNQTLDGFETQNLLRPPHPVHSPARYWRIPELVVAACHKGYGFGVWT